MGVQYIKSQDHQKPPRGCDCRGSFGSPPVFIPNGNADVRINALFSEAENIGDILLVQKLRLTILEDPRLCPGSGRIQWLRR